MFFFEGATTTPPIEYIYFILCKEFGWTWHDLQSQPAEFVDNMIDVMGIVRKYQNKR